MPSTNSRSAIYRWATAQRQLTIFAGVAAALPAAYAFRSAYGSGPGSFLLLVTLGVVVPTAYDEYWPAYDRAGAAVAWILVACAVAATAFVACYLVGTEAAGLGSTPSAAVAFLATDLGGFALLAVGRRTRA
ncbi:hypothetical protein [Halobellus sp. EA9]|uniref:hypothetical protein n=1 Tax=Halobellus sp. EA9 TaxID=3421647 RepID=UPI003EB72117